MCGITGIIHFDGARVERAQLERMNRFMLQRGPDGEGYWSEGAVGFAHRRLSVIDLSERGLQPMQDTQKRAVITFNGEIYNYNALRSELLYAGYSFTTSTDTEVILNGYLHWGINKLLQKLEGMFAFVLYDKARNTSYMCRDRFGKKPLYYSHNTNKLLFSSDIRSISSEGNFTLNRNAVDYYLTELSVPQPLTIWNEISQVRPAHYLTLNILTGEANETCYWKLNFGHKLEISLEETEHELEKRLTDAILKRLAGDVEIGCFLSGGADSGLIASILASNSGQPVNTYSVGFTYEEDFNELPLARKLARRYGTNHTEIIVESNILELMPALIEQFGEPFADSSNIPTYYISHEIGKNIKVALAGDGGDELFGGYHDYALAFLTDRFLGKYRTKSMRMAARVINAMAYRTNLASVNYGSIEHYGSMRTGQRLYREMGFTTEEKRQLYSRDFAIDNDAGFAFSWLDKVWEGSNKESLTDTLFEASFQTRLLNDYLVKVDRASMMNSLEVRTPFLDHHLAEFAASIPNSSKLKNGTLKYLLKKLAVKYIDDDFFRRKKQGFGIPLDRWIRTSMEPFVKEALFSGSLEKRGVFNMDYVKRIFDEHREMKKNNDNKIWTLVCLELWFRKFYNR